MKDKENSRWNKENADIKIENKKVVHLSFSSFFFLVVASSSLIKGKWSAWKVKNLNGNKNDANEEGEKDVWKTVKS